MESRGMEGKLDFGTGAPHGDRKEGDVQIRMNGGNGPVINFRLGLTVLINIITMFIAFAVATGLMKADVDALKTAADRNTQLNAVLLEKVARMETTMEYIREEIRYLRVNGDGNSKNRR
jgi:hypothetical protein